MKKSILLVVALCSLLLMLAGCGNDDSCEGCLGCLSLYDELNCEIVLRLRTDYRNQTLN
jgi:hypothetical protein